MTRAILLKELINKCSFQRYLEIGVYKGKTFLPIPCKFKIAVDPFIKISPIIWAKSLLRYPNNFNNRYYFMTSDRFFKIKRRFLENRPKLELIFIDGLHTFEASLRDLLNSLPYLAPNGVVVLHDCLPPNKAAATPANSIVEAKKMDIPGWTGAWCGDVWKTISYLRRKYPKSLDVFVINADLGLGVVTLIKNKSLDFKLDKELFDEINCYEFDYLIKNPEKVLGLKEVGYVDQFIKARCDN